MATGNRQIKPWISPSGNSFGFPTGDMNYFGESLTCINSTAYQEEYGVYSFMNLNKKGRHVLNFILRDPFVWQKENFCEFTPMGKLGTDKVSIIPCEGKVNIQICTEDFLNTCFDLLYTWNRQGRRAMDAELVRMLTVIYREYSMAINEGARIVGLLGNIIESSQIDTMFEGKDKGVLAPFKSTLGICNGVFAEARRMAAEKGMTCLNDTSLFKDLEYDGCLLTEESVLKIHDRIMDRSRKKKGKLRTLANKKRFRAAGGGQNLTLRAMVHISPLIWESIAHAYTTRCDTLLNPQCRIEQVMVGTGENQEEGYKIDGIIYVPVDEASELEECLNGRFLFAYFTFAGNFQLGGSFYSANGRNDLGMRITDEGANSGKNEGQITIISHALFSGTILNKNIVYGGQMIVPDSTLLN